MSVSHVCIYDLKIVYSQVKVSNVMKTGKARHIVNFITESQLLLLNHIITLAGNFYQFLDIFNVQLETFRHL